MTAPHLDDLTPEHWQTRGNCVGLDVNAFFPGRGDSQRDAKAVCKGCTVQAECLTYALDHGLDGIWGATSWRTRRLMSSERVIKGRPLKCVGCSQTFMGRDSRSKYCADPECRRAARRGARSRYEDRQASA